MNSVANMSVAPKAWRQDVVQPFSRISCVALFPKRRRQTCPGALGRPLWVLGRRAPLPELRVHPVDLQIEQHLRGERILECAPKQKGRQCERLQLPPDVCLDVRGCEEAGVIR